MNYKPYDFVNNINRSIHNAKLASELQAIGVINNAPNRMEVLFPKIILLLDKQIIKKS
jgi:hypothetical protein